MRAKISVKKEEYHLSKLQMFLVIMALNRMVMFQESAIIGKEVPHELDMARKARRKLKKIYDAMGKGKHVQEEELG